MISAIDSSLILEHSSLSDFNVTFLYGVRSIIYISDSVFEGGLDVMDKNSKVKVTAGLLDQLYCPFPK